MTVTNSDHERPDFPTVEQIADDLDLSNQEGGSWFGYAHDPDSDTLMIELYADSGEILKTFRASISFEEVAE